MGGLLSSLLSVGTQAGGDYAQAQREASQMKLQQVIQAMMMRHTFDKDAAQMDMNKSRGAYYAHMAGQPNLKESGGALYDVTDPNAPKQIVAPEHKLTPRTFSVDGTPTEGFSDDAGNFYDASHQPIHGKVTPYERPPQNTYTPFQGTSPETGQPVVRPFNTKTGQFGPVADVNPRAQSGGMGGSLTTADRDRMLAQAKIDNDTMKAYENKVLSGQAKVGTVAGVAGALSRAHGGALNDATAVLGNAVTGALDPGYQEYITAQNSYGRIMGNLQSRRYTDHQAEIERSISGLQGNDLANTIRYKQRLRDESIADPAVQQSAAPSAGSHVTPSAGGAANRSPSKPRSTSQPQQRTFGYFRTTGG